MRKSILNFWKGNREPFYVEKVKLAILDYCYINGIDVKYYNIDNITVTENNPGYLDINIFTNCVGIVIGRQGATISGITEKIKQSEAFAGKMIKVNVTKSTFWPDNNY